MRQVLDDAELRRLHAAGLGLIYNDFSGRGSGEGNVLHAASCSWVPKTKASVRKYYFDTVAEARAWLRSNRGQENVRWKRCGSCEARARESNGVEHGALPTLRTENSPPPVQVTARPFTEGMVEDALVPWFTNRGYVVTKRVSVHNGIVDLVASRDRERWVVEAKGEDKGGYTSAEMNFQIGIGQIVSRMDATLSQTYALAVPVTPDFRRVLRKFRGTPGFERLALWLFTVDENRNVRQVQPSEVAGYLGSIG